MKGVGGGTGTGATRGSTQELTGKVKFWDSVRNYGMAVRTDGEGEVFVLRESFAEGRQISIAEGDEISFEIFERKKMNGNIRIEARKVNLVRANMRKVPPQIVADASGKGEARHHTKGAGAASKISAGMRPQVKAEKQGTEKQRSDSKASKGQQDQSGMEIATKKKKRGKKKNRKNKKKQEKPLVTTAVANNSGKNNSALQSGGKHHQHGVEGKVRKGSLSKQSQKKSAGKNIGKNSGASSYAWSTFQNSPDPRNLPPPSF